VRCATPRCVLLWRRASLSFADSLPPQRALNEATPSHGTQKAVTRALAALKAGKLPSNEQLVHWAELARNSSFLQEGPFERTGALSEVSGPRAR